MLKSWVLFLFLLALLFISLPIISPASFSYETAEITVAEEDPTFTLPKIAVARNLKETSRKDGWDTDSGTEKRDEFNVEDYKPVNPPPTTKASIKPGPIQHGSPLNPYVPKPPPPSPAPLNDGGS